MQKKQESFEMQENQEMAFITRAYTLRQGCQLHPPKVYFSSDYEEQGFSIKTTCLYSSQ